MAFPASTQTTADALAQALRIALRLKVFAGNVRNQMAAQTVSGNQVEQVMSEFKSAIEIWAVALAAPGIGQYAKNVFDDPALDIGAEFNVMVAAAEAVRDRVINDVPTDVSGWVLMRKYALDGAISVRQFTPAQTVNLRADLDSFIATVL